ncbi:tyrosine-protein kinase receptor Tie-1-like [Anneissia japonica]|uniref:tyrosine-protein kinase receptor Tie-1-like n=1 Tax=Anneissia japonica TaxID=1529436 RepID=UPI0014257421|nr:tyrosine-protein kinase receptor Tie-1-like [Anneissia japonica]
MFFLKELCFLIALIGHSTGNDGNDGEFKFNMVGFTSTPVVDDSGQNDVRGYTLGSDRSYNITLNISLVVDTNLSGQLLCENPPLYVGFKEVVKCKPDKNDDANWTLLKTNVISNTTEARIGVFTAYAEKGNRSGTATIIVHHANTPVIPIVRTKTVSVFDSNVTLSVYQCSGNIESLRWAKNGDYNEEWDGLTEILFEITTLNDSGIYECYINGSRNEGKHAFMQLIVRECPHNKWSPPNCNKECDVCYNGGVCDTYIGTCICPSGFHGSRCEISAGGNKFGRDGNIPCKSKSTDECKGNLICPPMPQGCACHAGWKGLDCKTECEAGKYGADCRQICHCDAVQCDPSKGCDEDATCHTGYNGTRCLDSPTSFRGHTTHGIVHSSHHTACSVTTTDGNVLSTKLTWTYNSYYSSMIVCLGMEEYV